MAKDDKPPPFSNGFWIWDDNINSLAFQSRDAKDPAASNVTPGYQHQAVKDMLSNIRFVDSIDGLGMARFRRLFQRRVKPDDPQIVTLQDVKDVVFFTAVKADLTPEFVKFMHTRKMDEFLRTLIVYFTYYFQVWDNLLLRREEAKRKLRQPMTVILENVVRDNLADVRAMVARNYAYVILGLGDTMRYYHMNNRNNVSLSDKDRHLYECLLSMMPKIVWIAMMRKNFSLIEMELNRMFRTKTFNIMSRIRPTHALETNADEDRVLLGKAHRIEKKLKIRSPAVQELILDSHDFRMLAIGQVRAEPMDARENYMEVAYTAPEELLFELNIGAGMLGLAKSFLSPILMPLEGMAKRIHLPPFDPPPLTSLDFEVGETLPKIAIKYPETEQSRRDRKKQCMVWLRYLYGVKIETIHEDSEDAIEEETEE